MTGAEQLVVGAAESLQKRGEPVDLLTLAAELDRTGDLDKIGGHLGLAELWITKDSQWPDAIQQIAGKEPAQ